MNIKLHRDKPNEVNPIKNAQNLKKLIELHEKDVHDWLYDCVINKNRIYCDFFRNFIMKTIISTLLVFFYLMVNVLALSPQKKHDPNVNWPTDEWSINTESFIGNSTFNNKVEKLGQNLIEK